MNFPEELRYAADHEWALLGGDGVVTAGITDYAQDQLGEVVWVGLPKVGQAVKQHQPLAEVESVKSASDVFSPCTGEVIEVNATLDEAPTTLNEDPYGAGWIARIKPDNPDELDTLLDADAYAGSLTLDS